MTEDQRSAWLQKIDAECPYQMVLRRRQLMDDSAVTPATLLGQSGLVADFRDRQLPRDDSAAFRAADRKTHRRSQIEQVCTDQVSEGLQSELKSDLSTRR
jgi:hypothetical protein